MFSPGQKFDRYVLKRELGAGGMGTVFLAENSLRLQVVLKILHPSMADDDRLRERFIREGQIQFSLRHPNVVRVTDIVEDHGIPALVVDYLEGEDLDARLQRGALSITEALEVAVPILGALQVAHEKGYIHRDLKPANVYLARSPQGRVPKLMDFGIAKSEESNAALTQFREFYGTPNYASPEQIESTKDVDRRADIYSWGAVLYQMLTGELPYGYESDAMKVLIEVMTEPFPALPHRFPSWLREVVAQATARDPNARFTDAAHFQGALLAGAATLSQAPLTAELRASRPLPDGRASEAPTAPSVPLPEAIAYPIPENESFTDLHLSSSNDWSEAVHKAQARLEAQAPTAPEPTLGRPDASSTLDASVSDIFGSTPVSEPAVRPRPASRASQRARPNIGFAKPTQPSGDARGATRPPYTLVAGLLGGLALVTLGLYYFTIRPIPAPDGWTRVEPGTFVMGTPEDEPGREMDEGQHQVTLTYPYAIMNTEVTRSQWIRVMMSSTDPFHTCGEDCPAVGVGWLDAVQFANALSAAEGHSPCYVLHHEGRRTSVTWPEGIACRGYRLPTEAEWEFAARAGATGATPSTGLTVMGRREVDPTLHRFAVYGANSAATYDDAVSCSGWSNQDHCGPAPTRSREANGWGIYDMQGNAAEWVWDYHGSFGQDATDPIGPPEGRTRVLRGGSWLSNAEECRLGSRTPSPTFARDNFGFRLVRTLPR